MEMILVLDKDGKLELKRGGIRRMLNMFQIVKKLEKYDSRNTDPEYPTIVPIRYLLMHLFVNDYHIDGIYLRLQDKNKFGALTSSKLKKNMIKSGSFQKEFHWDLHTHKNTIGA